MVHYGEIEVFVGDCLVCDGSVGHFADVVDVAGHAVYTDVGLGFGEFFVQEEEFLQEGTLGYDGADFEGGFGERSLGIDFIDVGADGDVFHRLTHGTAADFYQDCGTDVGVGVKDGRVFHFDGFRVGGGDGSDVNRDFEGIRADAVFFQLGGKVELEFFSHEGAGGAAEPVADLRPGELAAEAQELPVYGNINILRHALDDVPAFAEAGAALEGNMLGVWQFEKCPKYGGYPEGTEKVPLEAS